MNFNNNNGPPLTANSFASAATSKTTNAASGDNKISSAEFLSMLKKPSAPSITTAAPTLAKPSVAVKAYKEDDYTLQGLIDLIKACQSSDRNIFALGVDLEREIGLPMNRDEPIRDAFLSPWYDEEMTRDDDGGGGGNKMNRLLGLEGGFNNNSFSSSNNSANSRSSSPVEHRRPSSLDSIIPSCFHVPSLPASITKIASFADETLFYIFYAMPGDRMQELAARELFVRGWRFYKPTKSWITSPDGDNNNIDGFFRKAVNSVACSFFVFEQSTWIKVKRALTLKIGDLEDSRTPITSGSASPINSPEIMHGSGTLHSTSVTH